MCGLAGAICSFGGEQARAVTERMVLSQVHRGPDASGVVAPNETAALGSTRLAVLDLSAAATMPMSDPVTGNVLVYNGELYNHADLRTRLVRRGERFETSGDTEVMLKGLKHYGTKMFGHVDGMFALALWDAETEHLLLARDPLGEKPLYAADTEHGFLFASEVRALLSSGMVGRRIDPAGLAAYIANGFAVSPRTMVRGVSSIMPGSWLRVDRHGKAQASVRYWQLGRGTSTTKNAAGVIPRQLQGSIASRLVSDVPLAVFLSGGIDSALITAAAQRAGWDIHTVSLVFPGSSVDEGDRISRLVRSLGVRNDRMEVGSADFFKIAAGSLRGLDQPSVDGANTFLISRLARDAGYTVALSGLGADELFGGYPFLAQARRLVSLGRLLGRAGATDTFGRQIKRRTRAVDLRGLAKLRDLDLRSLPPALHGLHAYQVTQHLFPELARAELIHGDVSGEAREAGLHPILGLPSEFVAFLETELEQQDEWGRLSVAALRLFLGERALRDADGASMASSLELRTPFTARPLVEAVFQLSGKTRIGRAPRKTLELEAARDLLPEDWTSENAKMGFMLPFEDWLRSAAGHRLVEETLLDASAVESVGLDAAFVAELVERFRGRAGSISWARVWPLLSFLQWADANRMRI